MTAQLQEIKTILRDRHKEITRDYGVVSMGIFGSYARGEAAADSDIDILVEFNRPIGFFKFLELEERLSQWLGKEVDLVTKAALKPRIGRRILTEAVTV
ncbi:MAG: nucleotidyltransferase family protein [Thermodesulfobacteriota bacterium]